MSPFLKQKLRNVGKLLSVSLLKDATLLDHGPQEFWQVVWHFSGTERPLLVKFLIEESVVKLLPSASSLRSSYYLTHFAQSSFINRMRLTRDG